MKRFKMKSNTYMKRVMALLLCTSLFVSAAGELSTVHATESGSAVTESTEAVSSGTSQTTEAVNTDPNGTLGKNSDVGIEVTKSITGTAGKTVKVAFKLKSGNAEKVKLKNVYPVIDTDFPFETSGDAYKVETAGDDAEKQKELGAEFSMTARSDIETGYHSVRFIGEYVKIAADGSEKEYYIIKTINIYFKSVDFVPPVEDKKNPSKDKNKVDKEDEEEDFSSADDDEEDNDYSGGGSSSDEEVAAPKLVITGYETKPEKIKSGETFTLTIHVKNTSKKTSVCNGKFLIGNEAGTFLPTSGSSAVFVESIPAGETGDLVIEMKTSPDLAQKNYILVVKGDFDDGHGNNFTSSDNLSVPVYQDVDMTVTEVSMSPEILGVNDNGSLMFALNNKTNVDVYNVRVNVKDDAATAEECFVGNLAGSGMTYVTLNLTGVKDNTEVGTVNVVITYEDDEGTEGTIEKKVTCSISEEGSSGGGGLGGFDEDFDEDEDFGDDAEEENGISWWLIVLIVLIVLGLIAGIIVFVVLKKKKKDAELFEFDDDEFDDDDLREEDIENEDF